PRCVLENALHAPEATARDDGSLQAVGRLDVDRGYWDFHGVLRCERAARDGSGNREGADGGAERKGAGWGFPHGMASFELCVGIDGSLGRAAIAPQSPATPNLRVEEADCYGHPCTLP